MDERPSVVVVGAGFGGLAAVKALRKTSARITWIDRRNHHLFQPLLYQVATAELAPEDIAAPVREIARRYRNVDVVYEKVTGVDTSARVVRTEHRAFPYDYLVLATGAETSYFGKDKWRQCAFGLKSLNEAIEIRRKILLALEHAERAENDEERRRRLTFLLIGAGPTGVEMAGAIADLAKRMLARDYRHIQPEMITVILIEAMDQVLPGFPAELARYAHAKLQRMGVEVRVGTMVDDIDESGVTAGGERVAAEVVVWSAGVKATPVAHWLEVEADKKGCVSVGPDMSVPGLEGVFVIGDAADAKDEHGKPFPGLAAVAKQQGKFVARRIAARINGSKGSEPFRYRDWGTLATMGRLSAVADFPRFNLSGFSAWVVWALVHIWYLLDFRNRVRVITNWMSAYLRLAPGARLIVERDTPE